MVLRYICLIFLIFSLPAVADTTQTVPSRQLSLDNQPWQGDFAQMLDKTLIRVLVPYSRTFYFHDKGEAKGLAADVVREFERHINTKYRKQLKRRPVTVVIVPTTRDHLLQDLEQGLGDIAVGNLTITDDRLQSVDFITHPDRLLSERVITGPTSVPISSLNDLSGELIHVRPSSSYYQSLIALNQQFEASGKAPVKIMPVADAVEDEDLMEMLNAGVVSLIIVDDWKAKIWAQVLPKIQVTEISIRQSGHSGWAIRKNSPQLHTEVDEFFAKFLEKQHLLEAKTIHFNRQIKQIFNNTGNQEWHRFEVMQQLFAKYGQRYEFDPLMLAAQGYQESQLKQDKRGPSGAIGVMQVLPSTGISLKVGDIKQLEPNIHAGAKYLDELMSQYFADANFQGDNRTLFSFASYNAGPGKIQRMRKIAEERGLDPNRWFNHVELVVAEKIGWETTSYVRNIYKYYAAYKLQLEVEEQQKQALARLASKPDFN